MISLEWVKDYIDIADQDLKELAVKITEAGINVEKVISNHIDNLVIGKIESCSDHPNSDHLHVCQVNIGNKEIRQIVCGAPNVRKGLKVIVALPGAILPGDAKIKASKIRGVESNGMICALYELGLEEKTEESYNRGIEELDSKAPIGKDPLKFLGLEDTLYELDIHKHRNNDCYYHIGFAYEIAAILNRKVTLPESKYKMIKDSIKDHFKLDVKIKKCPYYLAKMVTNVKVGESPDFIKKRLIAAGMRSINNVVDISNYVMLEYGQPLHFFDKDLLGNHIIVRDALEGEKIITLDGKERLLKASDIVISNEDKAVCIAGVMGGENTEVTANTKNILIESAIFDPVSIRYTAEHLNLRSEASIRYGKGLNYEYTNKALDRACYLLSKYADATILSDMVSYDKVDKTDKIVAFYPEQVDKMLGIRITEEDMKYELERLDFPYKINKGKFIVNIPKRRLDIDPNINDIAEEIGRLYGYQKLTSTLPKTPIRSGKYIGDVLLRKKISSRLRTLGLNEVKTYTLTSEEMSKHFNYNNEKLIKLPNPMSIDKSVIRTSIIPSLINVYNYNKARHVSDIMLYEISKTYNAKYEEDSKVAILMKGKYLTNNWQNNTIKTDFYLIKGIIENLLNYLGFKNRYTFVKESISDLHPGMSAKIMLDREMIGIIGRMHPNIEKDDIYVAEISMSKLYQKKLRPLKFKEVSKYPDIKKDLAFIVKKDLPVIEITNQIRKSGGRLLTNIDIFDVYVGNNIAEDEKSVAFSLTFSDSNRTLEDTEVTKIFDKIIIDVEKNLNAKLRNK